MTGNRRSDRAAVWRKLIARHESSRLSVGALCRQAGVSTASFYAWRRRLNASSRSDAVLARSSSLVPVRVVEDAPGSLSEQAIEVTIDRVDQSGVFGHTPAICIAIPADCDEASIRRVLRAVICVSNEERTTVTKSPSSQGGASC
jgi:hypothetical protein